MERKVDRIHAYLKEFYFNDGIYRFSKSKEYNISSEAYVKFLSKTFDKKSVKMQGKRIGEHLREIGVAGDGLAIEIGCGSGRFTCPLVASGYFDGFLITDASEKLIVETKRRIRQVVDITVSNVKFGVMKGEDIEDFPDETIQSYFMAAVLHHFVDWKGMLNTLKRTLKPGGIIYFSDPCLEFSILMSILFMSFLQTAQAKNVSVSAEGIKHMRNFIGATKIRGNPYALGKEKVEDKHIFRMADIYQFAQENEMKTFMYPNSTPMSFIPFGERPLKKDGFRKFIKTILTQSQHIPDRDCEMIFEQLPEQIDFLQYFYEAGRAPVCNFIGILQKK